MNAPRAVLLTRPRPESEKLAGEIAARGFQPVIEPMLDIVPLEFSLPDLKQFAAIAFTSGNGVDIFAQRSAERGLPVHAVGDATAVRAEEAGFSDVRSARGRIEDLNRMLAGAGFAPGAKILHISGRDVAGDIAAPGVAVERVVVYSAEKPENLSDACRGMLDEERLAAAMFFSPRAASTFAGLIEKFGLQQRLKSVKALCISDSVVKSLSDLPFREKRAASHPDKEGMMALLEELQERRKTGWQP